MIGRATIVWLVLALGIGFGLYHLKFRVQELEQKLAQTNRDILTNEEAIHVLKADWSYLNRPEAIDPLARKFLGLGPMTGSQYVTFAALPMRPAPLVSSAEPPTPPAAALAPAPAPAPSKTIVPANASARSTSKPAPSAKPKASGTRAITLAREMP
ncbi:MAG TPA: hypothetical protein VMF53_16820 [Alphaproteobacteria bacterium]|nr:hypothetical protein [Alphaproteobacteria bacterium]